MAEDRTPRTVGPTESPQGDEAERPRRRRDASKRSREIRLDQEGTPGEKKESAERAEERFSSRFV